MAIHEGVPGIDTQDEAVRRAYERMDRENAAHLRGEEVEEDRVLLDAKEGRTSVHRAIRDRQGQLCWPPFHDPKGESLWMKECGREEPADKPKRERRTVPYALEEIVRLWVQEETGRLDHPLKHAEHDSDDQEAELSTLAWDYVSKTKGWCSAVHEAMRHLFVRNLTWEQWPRFVHHTATAVTRSLDPTDKKSPTVTEWVPSTVKPKVGRLEAKAAFVPFMEELERRVVTDPFVGHGLSFGTR